MLVTVETGGDPPHDHTMDLPNDCLALVFDSLGAGDRKSCSLVCRRWYHVEGISRHRLALDARAPLLEVLPTLLDRFETVTSLSLRCDRHSDSIGDDALDLIVRRLSALSRLKLRACRRVTNDGMAVVAQHCPALRRLSCASCSFGIAGIYTVLRGCPLLEDLSIKRLRGLSNATPQAVGLEVSSSVLRSICLKELYNAQCFASLIAGSPGLKTLKIIRCSGEWDPLLEVIAGKVTEISEVHLEKIQVSDRGLFALSSCLALEVLHLVKIPECTDDGVIAIAERCHLLRKVHIDGWRMNRIGHYGLLSIGSGCPELQELVLIGINPSPLSIEHIANSCRGLERLALCGCDTIGDAEIACIAARCMALKKLCIKGCPVSDFGLEALVEGCPSLIKIKLKRCRGVTQDGLDWLVANKDGPLSVSLDAAGPQDPYVSMNDRGMQQIGIEEIATLANQIVTLDLQVVMNGPQS
ncbi:F-box protein [Canna indica]|uniref:F-box protein n=1 Tax=Canna indica TaxID=4628 RepID=A0AAQ3KV54_9LILI|nr:F-box protein [Canna indica]